MFWKISALKNFANLQENSVLKSLLNKLAEFERFFYKDYL